MSVGIGLFSSLLEFFCILDDYFHAIIDELRWVFPHFLLLFLLQISLWACVFFYASFIFFVLFWLSVFFFLGDGFPFPWHWQFLKSDYRSFSSSPVYLSQSMVTIHTYAHARTHAHTKRSEKRQKNSREKEKSRSNTFICMRWSYLLSNAFFASFLLLLLFFFVGQWYWFRLVVADVLLSLHHFSRKMDVYSLSLFLIFLSFYLLLLLGSSLFVLAYVYYLNWSAGLTQIYWVL